MRFKIEIRYLFFTLFIIFSIFILIYFLIIPDMQYSKSLNQNIKDLKQKIKTLDTKTSSLQNRFFELNWYKEYLRYFKNPFTKKDLENLLNIYSQKVDIKVKEIKNEDLKIKRCDITIYINSPKDFYSFLEYIEENRLPIKIDYPIIFEKKDRLEVKFIAYLYSF